MNEKQAVEVRAPASLSITRVRQRVVPSQFCVKNASSACETPEWAAELRRLRKLKLSPEAREAMKQNSQARRDAANTDEAAFRAALEARPDYALARRNLAALETDGIDESDL